MNEDIKELKKELSKLLDEKRYEHTIGVADTACCLAMRYGIDLRKAYLAGLMHDCAKCYDDKKRTSLCEKYKVEINEFDRKNPALIHAKLGAAMAEAKYGIDEKDILSAIRYHTTGREDMTTLEKIIFSADYIEPNRKLIPGLNEIRKIIFQDLDEAIYLILENTMEHLDDKKQLIEPTSIAAYKYYQALHREKYIHS